jgi:ZIP family zinc transporter
LIALYLAAFSGIVIYLATSHILPEAHSRHSSRLTMVATISGVLIMWALVAYLHSGDAHAHSTGQDVHAEELHDDHAEEGHDDHAEEGHDDHAEEGHAEEDGHQHSDNE